MNGIALCTVQVYVIGVGPTARWYVDTIDGMAGSTDHVYYVESPGDVDTTVSAILDALCQPH